MSRSFVQAAKLPAFALARRACRWSAPTIVSSIGGMNERPRLRLPHPLILLIAAIAVAAALTWILPAGEYARRDDPVTHRSVVVAGTYHVVPRAPVGPFAAAVAIPRGFVEGAEVIAVVLLVGGA